MGEKANKPVRLLSTVLPGSNHNGKPQVVTAYNRLMGGVDLSDAMVDVFEGERKTLKVWKKLILHIFQRIMLNAYILYTKSTSDKPVKSRLRFTQLVIEHLAGNNEAGRDHVRVRIPQRELIAEGKEKDCVVCSRRRGS
ncbi:uncharacterized protein LOC117340612 [Pecten maximus]|uniref:uncharacterized protein LOC117340612 n=1 Tax=Pecten maximus TaxID=6579 RepID=UPI001458B2DF|nr:uncharacterized protein LOC117340612 [Pecten maximus]